MRVLWINDEATFKGGAETYIYQTAEVLTKQFDVENLLLYDSESRIDYGYAQVFTFGTVIADLEAQIEHLNPDIIYVQQVKDIKTIEKLVNISIPIVGFVHDHKHFCLREHKYTLIGSKTCIRKIGLGCYSCLGFIHKHEGFPYVTFKTLSSLKKMQNLMKRFSKIVVASEYMKKHLILHAFEESKIAKIALFSKEVKKIDILEQRGNEKRFLFVGQLVRGKGIDTLLQAFSSVVSEDIYLDICGSGGQGSELELQVEKLGIKDKVIFHGKVSMDDLSQYYLNAYAVVVPSRAPETFNLVGLEAMKHAKAVIATDVGGIGEWLRDKETGLKFLSNDSASLLVHLQFAIENPKSIEKMGLQGLADYEEKFTAQNHCHTLYHVFENILKKDAHGTS